ncbi:tol-pal system-associated acyl-CoA thioesterase [Zophobihabitans entericus]|uniref:Tol-pal system-associated acyl-CoA thioesterase n=1 Tax=Zophobihabitans entericus TaxID=1635327 RepID=A0A6G9IBL6_9GAMM|nr:tol-pal system-associated acyl-CoA thioesterase [Zophobihabitans entericus]QIQ21626.1 tol-pal system-associated acyl-CoA thioesterase [Zophobihabitans entericus]
MKDFKWQARVYYEDTDAGGVVYHARYLAFYERARTEMLRQYNIQQESLLSQNIAFVVKSMTIDYVSAARLDDLLTIECKIESVRRASLQFKQQILDQNGKLISQADVLIACVDISKMKPIALPQIIVAEFM